MRSVIPAVALAFCAGAAIGSPPGPGNTNSFDDAPRTFNDFPGSNLVYASNYGAGTVDISEDSYGAGGFANRHMSWFAGNNNNTRIDVDYGDAFTIQTTMQVNALNINGQVEAGIQADLFGFGFFGVLSGNGEIAGFGSTLPFHSFGTGLYNLGDDLMLEMIHTPGSGEGTNAPASSIEYRYNNLTTASGWVSSGAVAFTNLEFGIPGAFNQNFGVGAQINQPATNGSVNIRFWDTSMVPTPATAALLGLGGIVALRRRR